MAKPKIKILEICPFSAGICGVWTRVISESKEFIKLGYEVKVFSSNIEKGTKNIAKCSDEISGIKIKRFPSKNSIISTNVYSFNFENELKKYNPDIVITHLLHPHSFKALKLCKKLNIPCYLVTHAPFNVERTFPLNLLTSIHRFVSVKPNINSFTRIIAITGWEIPYLKKLGVMNNKIIYIPNGIPEEFFTQKKAKNKKDKDILFLGRIAPVKSLETLINAAKILSNINFSIVGSTEKFYVDKLKTIIKNENIANVKFYPPVYNLKEKIKLIDEHKIFVLPSKREAMPQVLLEAMARGKIIISSKTDGGKEIIKEGKEGFLFDIGNFKKLSYLIQKNINGNKLVERNAEKVSKKYMWKSLIKSYELLFNKK